MTRGTPHAAATAGDDYLPGSGNGGYSVEHYDLDLTYRIGSNRLDGRAALTATATEAASRFSLDLAGLSVTKVVVDGRPARKYTNRGRKLHVWPAAELAAGASFVVEIRYAGNPRPVRGPWGEVGWEELQDGVIVASQPDGAPSWFPCNDHPGDKASYRIAVTADSPYRVVANGTLLRREAKASQTRWVYDQPEPMATYLATLQIGPYDLVELARKPVRQVVAVPPRLARRARHDFGRQPKMMTAFEKLFGPYPFPQYTVVVTDDELEIPVEAQGLSVFGANHLDGARSDERLVAHELAHQWFGNSLTVAAWRHIWLNEGFACYAEWLWSEASGDTSAHRLARHHWERLADLPQDLVIADPGPRLMFDDRLYKRGALTLHAVRLSLGDDGFFALLRSWAGEHRHGTVTTGDFVAHAQRLGGPDLATLLDTWLNAAPLPPLPTRAGP